MIAQTPGNNHSIVVNNVPLFSGVLASLVACVVPLVQGLSSGWSAQRTAAYLVLALLFIALMCLPGVQHPQLQALCDRPLFFLSLAGLLCLGLQSLSGNGSVQPIAFSVPFVHGALLFQAAPRRTLLLAGIYLGAIGVGQWLHGWRDLASVVVPMVSYSAIFGFVYAFVGLSVAQAAARQHADALAADLARERDYLARLVAIDALLTRELDLPLVMSQIAAAGQALAQAEQVRVWLREPSTSVVQHVASTPPEQIQAPPDDLDAALQATAAYNTGVVLVLPLLFEGENLGALELRQRSSGQFTNHDAERLTPFTNAAAVAIRNAQLYQQAGFSATLTERNRLARELHDTIAQGLTAITMQIDAAQRGLDRDPERARARLQRASDLSRATLDDVRRSVWTLASPLVGGSALGATLAEHCSQFAERTSIATSYQHNGPTPQLEHTTASQLMRIVQEALHNAEKHASASHIAVCSTTNAGQFQITISDNGGGFDQALASIHSGFGLTSMRERAQLVGGELAITSAPGCGTTVAVAVDSQATK